MRAEIQVYENWSIIEFQSRQLHEKLTMHKFLAEPSVHGGKQMPRGDSAGGMMLSNEGLRS